MSMTNAKPLCHYHYDPLDRLASRSPVGQDSEQCFYQKNRLTTEICGQIQRSWLQTPECLFAQQHHETDNIESTLIATDIQGSVLQGLRINWQQAYAYAPYGNRHPVQDSLHLPGFNRERRDPLTGHYLLGNGYRAFNPVLMRFNSPDKLSPFGEGGMNAYAYCAGDPANRADPTGHTPIFLKTKLRQLNLMRPKAFETKAVARNIKPLDTHIVSFEETIGRRKRLTLYGHGSRQVENNYHPMSSNQKSMTPDHVHHNAVMKGIDFAAYDDIRVLMCRSAAGGPQSFIAEFSEIINKPVSGYRLPVFASPNPQELINSIRSSSSTTYKQGVSVYKRNPFPPGTDQHSDFTYEKVTLQSTRL